MNKIALLALLIAAPAAAEGTRRHAARIDGAFGLSGLCQPVAITMDFDMDEKANAAAERIMTNINFTLDLLPSGGAAGTAYTMKPDEKRPRGGWAVKKGDEYEVHLEIPAFVGPEAKGSGLEWIVNRPVTIFLYASCKADLSECNMWSLSGVSTRGEIPDFRFMTSNRFSLAARN